MNMDDIYSKIAKEHGITVEEVKKEMQAAVDCAYNNPEKTMQERMIQARISHNGGTPTAEELIAYVIRQVKQNG